MAVNSSTWKRLPIAPRETTFNADETIARISAWAKGSTEKFAQPFLWQNSDGPANNKNSYRLPVADIVNGRMVLIPRAVFTAASIMSGAHGGLEETVQSEQERLQIKRTITEIYNVLQKMYGDRRLEAPWLKGRTPQERAVLEKQMGVRASTEGLTAARKKRTKYVRDSKGRFSETPSAGAQLLKNLTDNAMADQQKADGMNLRGKIRLYEGQKLLSSRSFDGQDNGNSGFSPAMAIVYDPDEGRELRIDFLEHDERGKWAGESPSSISTSRAGIEEFRTSARDLNEALTDYQVDFNDLIEDIEGFGGFDDPTTLDLKPEQMRKLERYWELADDGTFQEGTMTSGFEGDVKYRIFGNDSGEVGLQLTNVKASDVGDFDWDKPGVHEKSSFYSGDDWDNFYTETEDFFEDDSRVNPKTMPDEEFYEEDELPSPPGEDDPDFDQADTFIEEDLAEQDDDFGDEEDEPEDSGSPVLTGQAALDSVPAKLKPAPGGHQGNYDGEELDAPEGAGSVRALSEYEGVEYNGINGYLRNPEPRKREPWATDEQWERSQENFKKYSEKQQQRVDEIDKTMAVSKLPQAVEVERAVKNGHDVFGKAWYGDVIDDTADFDTQDRQLEEWKAGKRPNLTGLKWREDAYLSTSAKHDLAERYKRWAENFSPGDGEPVIMTIELPAGMSAIQLSGLEAEAEILGQRKVDMEIIKDNGVGADGFRRIRVRAEPIND